MDILIFLLGLLLGAGLVWVITKKQNALVLDEKNRLAGEKTSRETELNALREKNVLLQTELATISTRLSEEQKASLEKLELLKDAEKKLSESFQALSAQALQMNNKSFLELAKENLEKFQQSAKDDLTGKQQAIQELVKPLKESLEKMDGKIQDLETKRTEAYSSLAKHLELLTENQKSLQSETSNLVKALRAPQVRGRWGEMTLKRVAELAGMVEHCDFTEQESKSLESGRLRPDMIVRLPQGRQIVVDAKTPLQAYLEALESKSEEDQDRHLRDHARQLQEHLRQLSGKAYWDQFKPTPEFVVLFVPGENFFSAALKQNPDLIEEGVRQGVILATPTTLISLLKSVGYGWRQEQLARNAEEISELAQDLYKRIADWAHHFEKVGDALKRGVQSYNSAVGSLESRVLPQVRKFKELGVNPKEDVPQIEPVETETRQLQAQSLVG